MGASTAISLTGNHGETFKVERGVRHGCPLAPSLILIVGKSLTHMIKKVVREGRLKRVALLGDRKQQYISQYTNDSSFMVRGGQTLCR